jgi:zinc protease
MLRKTAVSTLLICIVFLAASVSSYALDVKRTVLDNGLVLMIVERHNLPVVKVSIGINAGNLHETEEKAGLASLTAALLTEGTRSRTSRQISEEIEFVGGSVGASGGSDYMKASLSVLKKDVDLGFELLSDIILNPVFPEVEFKKKVERTKAGLKAREEDPGFLSSRDFNKAVFGTHPYGRLVSGTVDSLDNIKRRDLIDFHSRYYVPNNAIMAVVGDITAEEVQGLIDRYFKLWKPKDVPSLSLSELAMQTERRVITINKDLTQANIILGHLGVSRDNPEYYALSVMNYILGGGGFVSRLMENVREDKGLAYSIYSYFSPEKYGGQFQVVLQTKNESANTAIEEVLTEMQRIRNETVTDVELSDAKSFLTGSFPMRIETSARIAGFLVAVEYYGLGVNYINNYPQFINSVTKEEVQRVAKKYLSPDAYTLVVVADQEKAALKDVFQ